MRLILASSADGFLARGPRDDMEWTGGQDKVAFRLLTQVGGKCYASYNTWAHLPDLKGRSVQPIGRTERRADKLLDLAPFRSRLPGDPVEDFKVRTEHVTTLGRAYHAAPDAWLIGGPRLAMEALELGMVDQVFMCHVPVQLFEPNPAFHGQGVRDEVTPWLMSRGERQNPGPVWRRDQRVLLSDGTHVDCWTRCDR